MPYYKTSKLQLQTVYIAWMDALHYAPHEWMMSVWFRYAMYVVHGLTLVNCSVNWIFYGAMNQQLNRYAKTVELPSVLFLAVVLGAKNSRFAGDSSGRLNEPLCGKALINGG